MGGLIGSCVKVSPFDGYRELCQGLTFRWEDSGSCVKVLPFGGTIPWELHLHPDQPTAPPPGPLRLLAKEEDGSLCMRVRVHGRSWRIPSHQLARPLRQAYSLESLIL